MRRFLFTALGLSLLLVLSGCNSVVPDVHGMKAAKATKAIEAAGFKVIVESKSDNTAKGTVISQSPSADTAEPGDSVTITVSTGAPMVRVPNIQGMMEPDPVLVSAGLKPRAIPIHGPIEKDAAGIGEAYRQNPRAGAHVAKGATVTYHFWWESQ